MLIRKASLDDIASMHEIMTVLARKSIAPTLTTKGQENLLASFTIETIKNNITGNVQYFLSELDLQIVGLIGIKNNDHLYHLFVKTEYQNRGIATKLWHVAKAHCINAGNKGRFTVNASVNSKNMYEKLGFYETAEIMDKNGITFIPMENTFEDN